MRQNRFNITFNEENEKDKLILDKLLSTYFPAVTIKEVLLMWAQGDLITVDNISKLLSNNSNNSFSKSKSVSTTSSNIENALSENNINSLGMSENVTETVNNIESDLNVEEDFFNDVNQYISR